MGNKSSGHDKPEQPVGSDLTVRHSMLDDGEGHRPGEIIEMNDGRSSDHQRTSSQGGESGPQTGEKNYNDRLDELNDWQITCI